MVPLLLIAPTLDRGTCPRRHPCDRAIDGIAWRLQATRTTSGVRIFDRADVERLAAERAAEPAGMNCYLCLRNGPNQVWRPYGDVRKVGSRSPRPSWSASPRDCSCATHNRRAYVNPFDPSSILRHSCRPCRPFQR